MVKPVVSCLMWWYSVMAGYKKAGYDCVVQNIGSGYHKAEYDRFYHNEI